MENSIRNRLLKYLEVNKLSISAFEKSQGFSNGSISKYLRGDQQSIGSDKLEHILNLDENLSAEWLMRGKGQMYTDSYSYKSENILSNINETDEKYSATSMIPERFDKDLENIIGEFSGKLLQAISRVNRKVDEIEKKMHQKK